MARLIAALRPRTAYLCPRCGGAGRVIGCMGTDYGVCSRCGGAGEVRR